MFSFFFAFLVISRTIFLKKNFPLETKKETQLFIWDRKAEHSSFKAQEGKNLFLWGLKAPWRYKILFGPIRFYRPDCSKLATKTERVHVCCTHVEERTWEGQSDFRNVLRVSSVRSWSLQWSLAFILLWRKNDVVKYRRRCNVLQAKGGLTVAQAAGALWNSALHLATHYVLM